MKSLKSQLSLAKSQKQIIAQVASHPAVGAGDIETLARFITENVALVLRIERVGVWIFNETKDCLINVDQFLLSESTHTSGAILRESEFKEEFHYLVSEKYVDASDPYTDPRTKGFIESYLKPNHITAMLDGVIRLGEELVGTLCFEHVGKKHIWEEDEILFCSQLGDQISITISSYRKNKLTAALSESEKKLIELNENLERQVLERTEALQRTNTELSKTISDLKKTQAQLVLSEKMASLGQLIAGIAHEINNPIAAIQSSNRNLHLTLLSDTKSPIYTEWLGFFLEEAYVKKSLEFIQIVKKNKDSVTGKDRMDRRKAIEFWLIGNGLSRNLADDLIDIGIELELILEYDSLIRYKDINTFFQLCIKEITISKCIEIIELAVERASKMTFALKNFSRYETTHTKVKFDIIENLETVITIYQNQFRKNVILHRLYSHVPLVEGYPEDLLHLWTNLIYNGLQAMEFKGEMVISVERVEGFVRITIEDSGKGIPEEIRNRIFEPFFTTKPLGEGSGLGLDISSKIIQRHNGSLDFESRPGKTKFFVSLPI